MPVYGNRVGFRLGRSEGVPLNGRILRFDAADAQVALDAFVPSDLGLLTATLAGTFEYLDAVSGFYMQSTHFGLLPTIRIPESCGIYPSSALSKR